MIYNTSNEVEKMQSKAYYDKLVEKGAKIELKKVSSFDYDYTKEDDPEQRTKKQNRYLHLILSYFGLCLGYSKDEAKEVWKRDICPDIFVYEKNNHIFVKSSADLDTLEMTKAIEKLKYRSLLEGHPLPDAENKEFLRWCENEIQRLGNYQYL
jgi:hypothetical protein